MSNADATNSNEDNESLCDKVDSMLTGVGDDEREGLLRTMVGLARGFASLGTAVETRDLTEYFDNAFTPLTADQRSRFSNYRDYPPAMIVQEPGTRAATTNGHDPAHETIEVRRILPS